MRSSQIAGEGRPARPPASPTTEVADALRRVGVVDVDSSTLTRAMYAADASLYRVVPTVVVAPRGVDEVVATVEVARQLHVPITGRGAGTSIAGNAVGTGIVMDFRRHLGRIMAVDGDPGRAVVEPGVVLDDLQRAVGPTWRFGPEPSTHSRATLGGMIGNNACGSRALAYGRTSDNVIDLEVVTADGHRLALGRGRDDAAIAALDGASTTTARRIRSGMSRIFSTHSEVIAAEFGRIPRQVSGYPLERLEESDGSRDAAGLLVGSEGTLALVTRATLALTESPAHTLLVVLGHSDLAAAADTVPAVLAHDPVAIEGIDARIVDALRQRRGPAAVPALPDGAGWLFVELGGGDGDALDAAARRLVADSDALDAAIVTDPVAVARLWAIREDGAGLSGTAPSGLAAHAGWEDAAVAPERLGGYLRDFEALLVDAGLTGMPYGHFGDGCLHIRIDFPFDDREGANRYREFIEESARLVVAHGGSLSGEHGDGRARGSLLPMMYSPEAIAAMRDVKNLFDPDNLLNPGVIVNPVGFDVDLRPVGVAPVPVSDGFALGHDGGDLAAAVHRCTGVGKCVASQTAPGEVMCPSYVTGREQDSTRGRARVLQELLRGDLITDGWDAPEVHEALDLCLSCKACASDCPTGVDMARWKAEVLHRRHGRFNRPRSHHSLGALPRWANLAALAPGLANGVLDLPGAGRLGRWLAGIDPRRDLPAFAATTFRASMGRRRAIGSVPGSPARAPAGPAVLWVDTFTDHFAPEAAVATWRVLVDAGFDVEVVTDDACCGLTWITTGQLHSARARLAQTVEVLSRYGDSATPIVGVEPPCVAVLRDDLVELLPDDRAAAVVAGRARTLAEVLATRRPDWSPPRMDGRTIVVQPHCHHHSVMGFAADLAILTATGAKVQVVAGCCGLAGNWGMETGHHDVSLAIADTNLLPALRAAPPDAIVLADGFSCRTQISQLDGRASHHLAQVLDPAAPRRPMAP